LAGFNIVRPLTAFETPPIPFNIGFGLDVIISPKPNLEYGELKSDCPDALAAIKKVIETNRKYFIILYFIDN
jgi:hypothetical protein